ncbi:MAG: RNA methyltransferase, partial [Chloroflexota bacterium]|nr:RNA methyltransferase [Chloroflexota bacterium]
MVRSSDEPISSPDNPQVRLARSLLDASGRRRQRAFLVEGLRLMEAAAEVAVPRLVLYAPPFGQRDARERRLLRTLQRATCPVRPVTRSVLAWVTDTVAPQGIVAVMPFLGARPVGAGGPALVLILDSVGDPGNAGTLLRTAAGAGVTSVVATKGTVDLYAPKVVRAGAGAHFLLDVHTDLEWDTLPGWLPTSCQVLLADAGAATPYWGVDWTGPSALVVSSEAHGASAGARAGISGGVSIPSHRVESLNVAVAGSIILFEAA